MRRTRALALLGAATALAAGAFIAVRTAGPQHAGHAATEATAALVPGLAAQADSIAAIEVMQGAATVRLDRQADGTWVLTSNDSYPIETERVRGVVVSVGALTLGEPMTARVDRHGDLALAWPDPTGQARRVRLLPATPGAPPVADIVLGGERAQPDTVFARHTDAAQTYAARGRIYLPAGALGWVNRSLLALPAGDVTAATLRGLTLRAPAAPATPGAQQQQQQQWSVERAHDGPGALEPWTDTQIAAAQGTLAPHLQRLEFDGVRRARAGSTPDPAYSPVFTTRGGTIALAGWREADGVWFRVVATPGEAGEVARLAARADGWEYRMPDWQAEGFTRLAPPPLQENVEARPANTHSLHGAP